MARKIIILSLLFSIIISYDFKDFEEFDNDDEKSFYKDFCIDFGKKWDDDSFFKFKHNFEFVKKKNFENHKKGLDFELGFNKFSDLEWDEFQQEYLMDFDDEFNEIDFDENFQTVSSQEFLNTIDEYNSHNSDNQNYFRFLQYYRPVTYIPAAYGPVTYGPVTYGPVTYGHHYYRPHAYRSHVYTPYSYSPQLYRPRTYKPRTYIPRRKRSKRKSSKRKISKKKITKQKNTKNKNSNKKNINSNYKFKIDPQLVKFPKQKSWKNSNYKIRDQKKCASCYAFAAIYNIESIFNLKNRNKLSVQEILDCDRTNLGCKGGNPYKVFKYINKYGISYENKYTYKGIKQNQCLKQNIKFNGKIHHYYIINPVELIIALQKGPAIIIHHANQELKSYKSGIFNDPSCNGKLNHSALAVGYDLNGSEPWVEVMNAWGTGWGQNGYYKISLGKELTKQQLGICKMFTHPYNIIGVRA